MPENRWISDQHWRRESRQSRSEKTQTALLNATEDLIVEKGVDETSIADIAKRAGCSVGAVYHHFKDKQALYFALFDRMTEFYAAATRGASDPALWADAGVRDIIRGYVDFMIRMSRESATSKAAVALVVADHPDLQAHMAELQSDGRRAVVRLILAKADEIGTPDPESAAAFYVDQLGAMLRGRIDPTQRKAAIADADDDEFIGNMVKLAEGYLALRPEQADPDPA